MLELKNPYITVYNGTHRSYGGSQMDSDSRVIVKCGCGPVAALDVLLYLDKYHSGCKYFELAKLYSGGEILRDNYQAYLKKLIHHFLPVIPHFGMNGITLALGMNLYFHRAKMPYHAHWGVSAKKTWRTIEEMLSQDIPVILAVGPNFPRFWQKNTTSFYAKANDGSFRQAASVRAHFVTATGIDDEWLQISSWGNKYFINRAEFSQYVKKHSVNYLSSLLYISKK